MHTIFFLRNYVVLTVLLLHYNEACLFRQKTGTYHEVLAEQTKNHKVPELPWQSKTFPRKLASPRCACGFDEANHEDADDPNWKDANNPQKPWNFYVHVQNDQHEHIRTCVATLINSKMLLTSHNCLRTGHELQSYELWKPRPLHFKPVGLVTPKNLQISQFSTLPLPPNAEYPLEQIIFHENFDFGTNGTMANDVAILVLAEHIRFSGVLDPLTPICLPKDKSFHSVGFRGYYYGHGGLVDNDPTPESRQVGNVIIRSGEECDKSESRQGFSGKQALCIETRLPTPTELGGPLLMATDGKVNNRGYTPDETVFLVGIAAMTNVTAKGGNVSRRHYTYFSNVILLVGYLEFYANLVDAKWCDTPDIVANEANRIGKGERMLEQWEYEGEGEITRDESLDCSCGLLNEKSGANARIIGGEDATPLEFGWLGLAQIHWKALPSDQGNTIYCGCTLVADRIAITAAHCTIFKERLFYAEKNDWVPEKISVTFRKHKFSDRPPSAITVNVKKVYYHQLYTEGQLVNDAPHADIAVLVLESPIQFSNARKAGDTRLGDVRPICVPKPGKWVDLVGNKMTVAGWGQDENDQIPNVLQKLEVTTHPLTECVKRTDDVITDEAFCGGFFNGTKNTSPGDSGGPGILWNSGKWTLVGVVSADFYGYDQDTGDILDTVPIYTNVQKFLRFIDFYANKYSAKWCKY